MSGISVTQAQEMLDKLIEQQLCDPAGTLGSVTVGGRTVSYRSAEDLIRLIDYWRGLVTELQRQAAGMSRIGMKLAKFS